MNYAQSVIEAALNMYRQYQKLTPQQQQAIIDRNRMSSQRSYQQAYAPQLRVLKQNTIDQLPLTPRAKQLAQSVDARMMTRTYPGAAAVAFPMHIQMHKDFVRKDNRQSADIFSHELIHAIDDNMFRQSMPDSTHSSMGFSKKLGGADQKAYSSIYGHMKGSGIYDMKNKRTKDMEMMAYFGSNPKNLAKAPQSVVDAYSGYYQPMTKAINYSPVYPLNW